MNLNLKSVMQKQLYFQDAEIAELTEADYTSGTDNFLKDLQNQASEKTRDVVEYCAVEKKIREYLTIETELPLKLEDWMMDEKCWCTELSETMSLTEEIKMPVKQ